MATIRTTNFMVNCFSILDFSFDRIYAALVEEGSLSRKPRRRHGLWELPRLPLDTVYPVEMLMLELYRKNVFCITVTVLGVAKYFDIVVVVRCPP